MASWPMNMFAKQTVGLKSESNRAEIWKSGHSIPAVSQGRPRARCAGSVQHRRSVLLRHCGPLRQPGPKHWEVALSLWHIGMQWSPPDPEKRPRPCQATQVLFRRQTRYRFADPHVRAWISFLVQSRSVFLKQLSQSSIFIVLAFKSLSSLWGRELHSFLTKLNQKMTPWVHPMHSNR